jgi:hypothetical protein
VAERNLIPLHITLDGQPERSETPVASAGPYALVLSSVLPDRAVELHSTYLGHPGALTQASHLLLAREVRDRGAEPLATEAPARSPRLCEVRAGFRANFYAPEAIPDSTGAPRFRSILPAQEQQ